MAAFLLTWKKAGWPFENITRMVLTFKEQGYVDEDWRLIARTQVKLGDRVWALKQEGRPRGIFGVGNVIKLPSKGPVGNGKHQWMAGIRFEAFVNPMTDLLIDDRAIGAILSQSQISARASGYRLQPDQSLAFESVYSQVAAGRSGNN